MHGVDYEFDKYPPASYPHGMRDWYKNLLFSLMRLSGEIYIDLHRNYSIDEFANTINVNPIHMPLLHLMGMKWNEEHRYHYLDHLKVQFGTYTSDDYMVIYNSQQPEVQRTVYLKDSSDK